jgi:prepilin-type N-terminal cleavage/methylation domain-containing protein
MKRRKGYLKFLHSLHHGERGFTLLELLMVIAILGSLSGIVTMNINGFIGSGQEEARDTEGEMVQTAAITYISDGNIITEPFTVGPESQGVLDSYLIGNLNYSWTIDVNGKVNLDEGDDSEPEPEPEPKPKPKPKPSPNPKPVQPWRSF